LPAQHDRRVLIDYRTSDDAGVYKLDETRALVQTVDFFTPIVDDPFVYGQIAAANALSDVYAMGGRPLTALAIAGFPREADRAILQRIFAGGLDKLAEAGVALLGGHTVQDAEIKFGYAVTGEVDPARVLANAGAQAGDALLLTKSIGTGIIATALKFGRAPEAAIEAAVRSMTTLNRAAAVALQEFAGDTLHACTDITGFGLIGHACEMAAASGCSLEIEADAVPLIDGARALVRGNIPGGGRTNREYFGARVRVVDGIDADLLDLLYDPQTSGGLVVAVEASRSGTLLAAFESAGVSAVRIGRAITAEHARVVVV
jgi:selenide, water dikinase